MGGERRRAGDVDVEALLGAVRDARAGATFLERMEHVSGALGAALKVDTRSVWAMDLARPAEARAFFRGRDEACMRQYLETYRQLDPMNAGIVAADSRVMLLSDAIPDRAFGGDPFTSDFLPRANVRYIMGATGRLPDGLRLGIAFQRDASRPAFGERERALLQRVIPDVVRAGFGALLREKVDRLARGAPGESGRGAVVFDAQGDVAHADPDGLAALCSLGGEGLERLSDDARRFARREGDGFETTRSTCDGRPVSIEAARFCLGGDEGVLVTLAVRQAAVSRRALAALARAGVSAREQEVACLAADGLTNREIAAQLAISPATVSVHMTRVFRKLDVAGRTALARWMHDAAP